MFGAPENPLSQPARSIAPESRRLLREARRMKKEGFGRTAEELAMASSAQKSLEPSITSSENMAFAEKLGSSLQDVELAQQKKDQASMLQGRVNFAQSIEDRAKNLTPGENLYEKSLAEAPKFGVNPADLANFFKKKNLSYGSTPRVQGASGIQGATGGMSTARPI
jgi:hypothetical protein